MEQQKFQSGLNIFHVYRDCDSVKSRQIVKKNKEQIRMEPRPARRVARRAARRAAR